MGESYCGMIHDDKDGYLESKRMVPPNGFLVIMRPEKGEEYD